MPRMARSAHDGSLGRARSCCCRRNARTDPKSLSRGVHDPRPANKSFPLPSSCKPRQTGHQKRNRSHRTRMKISLARRITAEFLGTAFLVTSVIGSGIMGERLANGNVAVALLANTLATGAALVALIMALGP